MQSVEVIVDLSPTATLGGRGLGAAGGRNDQTWHETRVLFSGSQIICA